jgi:hypothetical protein
MITMKMAVFVEQMLILPMLLLIVMPKKGGP